MINASTSPVKFGVIEPEEVNVQATFEPVITADPDGAGDIEVPLTLFAVILDNPTGN
jgi:hypothetical protein